MNYSKISNINIINKKKLSHNIYIINKILSVVKKSCKLGLKLQKCKYYKQKYKITRRHRSKKLLFFSLLKFYLSIF